MAEYINKYAQLNWCYFFFFFSYFFWSTLIHKNIPTHTHTHAHTISDLIWFFSFVAVCVCGIFFFLLFHLRRHFKCVFVIEFVLIEELDVCFCCCSCFCLSTQILANALLIIKFVLMMIDLRAHGLLELEYFHNKVNLEQFFFYLYSTRVGLSSVKIVRNFVLFLKMHVAYRNTLIFIN